MKNSKEFLIIWQVIDMSEGEPSFAGTFKQLKKFTLEVFEINNDEEECEKMTKKLEKGDEVDYFKLLEDMDYDVREMCTITKDDFTEKTIEVGIYYYTNDEGEKVYDTEEMTNEFETKLKQLSNE
jgi:hypothetical protein